MARFILSRLLQAILVLFCILTITFILARLAPGNPFQNDRAIPAHVLAKMDAYYGRDKPVLVQYAKQMWHFATLNLGPSFGNKGFTVNDVIAMSFPVSFMVGCAGLVFALAIGIPIGILSAVKRNTGTDYSLMGLALIGICLPTFVIGPFLSIVIGIKLNWLPALGWETPSVNWILPGLTLGLFYGAYFARLTRAGMLETLSQDYIRTARSKGLSETRVILMHAVKGGLVPVVGYIGPAVAALIGGSFVMESVFQLPGLGTHFIRAVTNRDTPLLLGCVATFGVIILLTNLLSDILLAWLNPRQRGASTTAEA
ncbi:MAG: oligopeptide transport system permease protein [Verrucomicrobiales bacterium]|jgi:oligopeptide transport system permease protein